MENRRVSDLDPQRRADGLRLSVVIPMFNEEAAAETLLGEVVTSLAAAGLRHQEFEIVVVDDGSRDGTPAILDRLAARDGSRLRVLRFANNCGQGAALFEGLRRARGEILVTLDGDGQNDPASIPDLLRRFDAAAAGPGAAGLDMIVGVRTERRDSWLRRRMSRIANAVRRRILRDGVRDSGCSLKVMRREVVAAFLPLRTLYSFMPALAVAAGFRVGEAPVLHRPRMGGRSAYGLRVMLWRPLLDMMGIWWFTRRRAPSPAVADSAPPHPD